MGLGLKDHFFRLKQLFSMYSLTARRDYFIICGRLVPNLDLSPNGLMTPGAAPRVTGRSAGRDRLTKLQSRRA